MNVPLPCAGRAIFGKATLCAVLLLSGLTLRLAAAEARPQLADPESVGFSSERLRRLDALMQRVVDEKEYAGVVTILARHGKVIHLGTFGKRDMASGAPMERDTIFRINSSSKPITGAAMMTLYEEGKWNLQDPISKFVPQFAGLKVFKGLDSFGKMILEEPVHPPTMLELMTMTAGFTYGTDPTPVDRLYRDEQDKGIMMTGSLAEMIDRVAKAPLQYQPSTRWVYSLSVDIQGYMIEKLSGMTLPEFLKERLFEPLGMKDTDFYVPKEKRDRFASLYMMNEQNELVPFDYAPYGLKYDEEPSLPMGGAGMVSTAVDYYRFAQMLLNGGELNGVRILGPQTVKVMTSNHLPDRLMSEYLGGGYQYTKPRPGFGYGFDGAVVTDPGLAGVPIGKGSYMWDGASGTWFWIDPTYDILFVGMVQRAYWGWSPKDHVMGMPPNLQELSRAVAYQALVRADL
jgi:CubicO group peptidase (beta-lactamase class C family)